MVEADEAGAPADGPADVSAPDDESAADGGGDC